jgi:hypothetical protein
MVLILTPLLISMLYHGTWNLSNVGETWWQNNISSLPQNFRYVTGASEPIVFFGLLSNRYRKYACILGACLMLGAFIVQLPNGYSYKS